MTTRDDIVRYSANFVEFCADNLIQTSNGKVRFGDVWFDFQREAIETLAPSVLAIAHGHKPPIPKAYLEWTKSCGKDYILGLMIDWISLFASVPFLGQICAVDADNAADIIRTLRDQHWCNPWRRERIEVQNYKILGDSVHGIRVEIEICATDLYGSEGDRPLLLVLNEIHALPDCKFDFAHKNLNNAAKVPGLVLVLTNAPIRDTAAFKFRQNAIDSPLWLFMQHAKPSPVVSAEELADAMRRAPLLARRVFYGEVTEGCGDALTPEDVAFAFAKGLPSVNVTPPGWVAFAGLDGAEKKHFAAFVVVGKNTEGRYRVLRCWLWKPPAGGKIDLEIVEQTIAQAAADFGIVRIATDPAKVEYIIQRLQRQGVPIEERGQYGRTLVEQYFSTVDAFSSRIIDCPDFAPLRFDLDHARVEEKSYGARLVSDEGPSGHGDLLSALSICLASFKTIRIVDEDYGPPEFSNIADEYEWS